MLAEHTKQLLLKWSTVNFQPSAQITPAPFRRIDLSLHTYKHVLTVPVSILKKPHISTTPAERSVKPCGCKGRIDGHQRGRTWIEIRPNANGEYVRNIPDCPYTRAQQT